TCCIKFPIIRLCSSRKFEFHRRTADPELRILCIHPLTMPPTPKLPAHLPKTWKYGNRNLKPGLSPGPREEYKSRIITPKVEPIWSRGVKFANFVACA